MLVARSHEREFDEVRCGPEPSPQRGEQPLRLEGVVIGGPCLGRYLVEEHIGLVEVFRVAAHAASLDRFYDRGRGAVAGTVSLVHLLEQPVEGRVEGLQLLFKRFWAAQGHDVNRALLRVVFEVLPELFEKNRGFIDGFRLVFQLICVRAVFTL